MRNLGILCSGFALGLALACGGGHGSSTAPASATTPAPAATGLAYTDPAGTGWRLVKDASSTSTRIVLNLVGPSGLLSRGAGLNLKADAGVHFGTFPTLVPNPNTDPTDFPVKETGVYELYNIDPVGTRNPLEPILVAGAVKKGNMLTAGVFQKDRRATAKDSGSPLLRIALELAPNSGLRVGDALPLTLVKAQYMAEDIGAFSVSPTAEMIQKAHLVDMTVALGTLRAN